MTTSFPLPESPLDQQEDIPSDLAVTATVGMSLDDLLAESMAEKFESDKVKQARLSLSKGWAAPADREALNATIRSWENRREWIPQAAVVMFSRQMCQCCGNFSTQFLGYFQRQTHRHSKVDRWIPSVKPQDDRLLRESKYQDSISETCENCAEEQGFEVEEA